MHTPTIVTFCLALASGVLAAPLAPSLPATQARRRFVNGWDSNAIDSVPDGKRQKTQVMVYVANNILDAKSRKRFVNGWDSDVVNTDAESKKRFVNGWDTSVADTDSESKKRFVNGWEPAGVNSALESKNHKMSIMAYFANWFQVLKRNALLTVGTRARLARMKSPRNDLSTVGIRQRLTPLLMNRSPFNRSGWKPISWHLRRLLELCISDNIVHFFFLSRC